MKHFLTKVLASHTELHKVLRHFFGERTRHMQQKFHRTLPFGELVVDRWDKAALLGFGEKASIYDSAIVFGDVTVGAHTWIGPQVVLDGAAAPISIGAWCSISAAVHIYTHDSVAWALTSGKAPHPIAPVTIGNRVYIGPMTVIAKGVTIGDGCIIGANSLVNTDIPAGHAAWGTPARITGQVELYEDGAGYDIVPLHNTK